MASLCEDGWRQGSIIEVVLPLDAIVLGDAGRPERASSNHGRWVVVTQDCDLNRAERDAPIPVVELRPVFTEGCPADWGIRSAKLRLTEDEYVESTSPRATVAPNVLTAALGAGAPRQDVGFARRQGVKTWSGFVTTGQPSPITSFHWRSA